MIFRESFILGNFVNSARSTFLCAISIGLIGYSSRLNSLELTKYTVRRVLIVICGELHGGYSSNCELIRLMEKRNGNWLDVT